MSARPMRLEIYRSDDYRGCKCGPNPDGTYRECGEIISHGWRWRIRATNGRILADSGEAYGRLRDCAHGAGLVLHLNLSRVRPGNDFTLTRSILQSDQAWRIVVDK